MNNELSIKQLSIVVPFYNEEKNVGIVIDALVSLFEKNDFEYEILAVNNGSNDGTEDIIKKYVETNHSIRLVKIINNIGYGNAIIQGLSLGKYHAIGYIDGDGQINPADILNVYDKLIKGKFDICKGYRVSREDGADRKISSFFFNLLVSLLFFRIFKDINAKPKLIMRDCFERLKLSSKDWFVDTELLLKASALGLRIGYVPVDFKRREKGISNVHVDTVFEFLKNLLSMRINMWKKQKGM